jgi:hypothetical protein
MAAPAVAPIHQVPQVDEKAAEAAFFFAIIES